MYLKSLQLCGFKSFAEKTSLEFLPGVTAIVGPNGCGKSNVADAIRWVLGEQSAKALRGSEMADCIFNGTDGRKPIGMAEVSMTFAEVDPSLLSMPGLNLDFSEITITRRVYRDGTGEYLINKTPCRLRDIQQMFMDTGMGRSSYSLMAQGQIDQILSAHPEDRRMIFEEAAGINKYKHQKKEALRKLEYTEANLVRLTDIIKEVKRQIISLQRQAGKARRYKELFDQLKTLDTRLSRHKYDLLHGEITGLEAEVATLSGQADQFNDQIAEKEQQVADLRRSLNQIEQAISEAVNRDHQLKNESDRHQQRITTNTERITELEDLIKKSHLQIAGSEEKIRIQEQDLARLNSEYEQIDGELAAEQTKLQEQQESLRQLDSDLSQKNRFLDEAKTKLIDLESTMARGRNELGGLDQKKKHDTLRTERLSTEKIQLEDQRRALQQQLDTFNKDLSELRAAVDSLQTAVTTRSMEFETLSCTLQRTTEAHHTAATEASQKQARLEVLRQFFAAPDGRATLANILEVDGQYGAAIEAALNHSIRTVLVDDLAAARELLASGMKNPAVAAPELFGESRSVATESIPNGGHDGAWPSNTVTAASVVRVRDERFGPLVQSLLRGVVIANDMDAALALRQANPTLEVATLRGEFIDEHGILSAVSSSHIAEIGALSGTTAQLQCQTADLAGQKSALEQQKAAAEGELTRLRTELHEKQIALASQEAVLSTMATERRDLESKIHTVVFELTSIEQQDAEENQQRREITDSLRDAAAQETQLREQVGAAQQTVADLRLRREELNNTVTEQRVHVGGIEHKRGSIQAQRDPIAGWLRGLQDGIKQGTDEIASHTGRIAQLRREMGESEQQIGLLGEQRQQGQQHLAGLQHQRNEVQTGIDHAEAELRAVRKQQSDAQQQKSTVDLALAQKRMEIQNLKDRVWQKYQANVEEITSDTLTITVADQGPAITEQVQLPTDWDALEQQVAEMQSRLDAMGPVNVEAIQEYDELEERFKFLSQQHEDLVKAKDQLLQVIAKINATTKQLFSETFEKIRTNFQAMYTELFGGGKANLLLLDENDPLETGIEIVAKPPGKQLQSITLLSGGEKTLTATALLFAVYMVKPSPFCVLDELDAPLDESNINRFIRILQRFIMQSQFVVITHNKRTIGMADALYGVTMEEHGVSKVVSVKFSPREESARKKAEQAREEQEERIDGAAVVATDLKPHEEPISNDLLVDKEETVAPITDSTPVAVPQPKFAPPVPDDIKAEVQAAVAAALEVGEATEESVTEATKPEAAGPAPEPQPPQQA